MINKVSFVFWETAVGVFVVIDILDQCTAFVCFIVWQETADMTEWLPLECEHYLSQRRSRGSLSLYLVKCAGNGRPIELLYSIVGGEV